MSIKDDFIYLNTTKKLLKNEINRVNNVIDDNSTFRSYPQELFNGYLDILNNGADTLWSNLEKVSQIGTEAVLENVETAPMKIELSGNTSQDTTEGYNILPNRLTQGTSKGITYQKKSDGSVVLNGTSTGTVDLYVFGNWNSDANTIVLSPQKYVLGIKYTEDEVNENVKLFIVKDKTTAIVNTSSRKILNIEQETTVTSLLLRVENETTLNNYVVYPILYKGEDLTTPYEPYTNGASPNPDYPQQVKVVKGENVVSVSGKNLFDNVIKNTIRQHRCSITYDNGQIVMNATDSDAYIGEIANVGESWLERNGQLIKVNGGAKYTLNITNSAITKNYITYYDENKVCLKVDYNVPVLRTFTIPENANYISIRLGKSNSVSGEQYIFNVMLEQGSTATPYVPYSKTDYPITLSAENHFKGEFRRGGAVSTTITTRLFSDDNYSMEAGKQYVFETNLDMTQFNFAINISTREFPTTAMFDTGWLSSNKYVFTCAMDGHLGIPIRKKDDSIITLEDIDGVWFKLYEPIVETEETLELCKINTYKDYFHKDSGKWYVHKEIGKIVLDGSETYVMITRPSGYIFQTQTYNIFNDLRNKIVTFSDNFKGDAGLNVWNGITLNTIGTAEQGKIRIYTNIENSIENFKNWLSSHNTQVYGVLATPTEEEITNTTLIEQLEAISKAKSVKEKTYVTQINDELPFILDVQAIKKYEVV